MTPWRRPCCAGWVSQAEFEEYVELLRLEYRRKRNFMKLLDGME